MISATFGSEDLEHQLEAVRALTPGEMEGVFESDWPNSADRSSDDCGLGLTLTASARAPNRVQ